MADPTNRFSKLLAYLQKPGQKADELVQSYKQEQGMTPEAAQTGWEAKGMNPENAQDMAKQSEDSFDTAEKLGMTVGGLVKDPALAVTQGPGIAGVKQIQDVARMAPSVESAATRSSRELIGGQDSYIKGMMKQMAEQRAKYKLR
jgi:hypothetical protein